MLAKRAGALPSGEDWIFEPKWDGFRTLIFRDGDEIFIQSRDAKPLNRYFPELLDPLSAQLPERCVADGEIVIARDGALDFEALQLRLHPAASRARLLSQQIPASVVFFDLLCEDNHDLRNKPFQIRRRRLEQTFRGRGTRWGDGEASRRNLRIRQARDAQGETRARLRLRGRGFSLVQEE